MTYYLTILSEYTHMKHIVFILYVMLQCLRYFTGIPNLHWGWGCKAIGLINGKKIHVLL